MDFTNESVASAVVVFGFKLNWKGEPQKILKRHLNKAVEAYLEGGYDAIVVCGYYPLKEPHLDVFCEADVMEAWLNERYPSIPVLKEGSSRCGSERWLYLRRDFPKLRRIRAVVTASALRRTMYFATLAYGREAADRFTYEVLRWQDGRKKREASLLRAARCLYGRFTPGMYQELFNDDGTTKVGDLVAGHERTCAFVDGVHP